MPLGTNAPIETWFRNSGTTQYGGHAHIVMPAVTGSAATGQASGAAGLVKSFARQEGIELAPNEIKQLITGTAFDVDAAGHRRPRRARPGAARLGPALRLRPARPRASRCERIDEGKIPPQALITSPEWFEPLNVNQQETVDIERAPVGRARRGLHLPAPVGARHRAGRGRLPEVNVQTRTSPLDGSLGVIDLTAVRAALDALPHRRRDRATRPRPPRAPATRTRTSPRSPCGSWSPTPPGNRAEDRKMLFAYRDATLHEG